MYRRLNLMVDLMCLHADFYLRYNDVHYETLGAGMFITVIKMTETGGDDRMCRIGYDSTMLKVF